MTTTSTARTRMAATGILGVLLGGSFGAIAAPGRVSAEELRLLSQTFGSVQRLAVERQADAEVLQELDALGQLFVLLWEKDFVPYRPAALFGSLEQPSGAFELGGFEGLALSSNASGTIDVLSPALSDRRVVFNNARASGWEEHGPKWGLRVYNVAGLLENLELWRVGDWTQGREGHAFYGNVAGDLTIRDLTAVQCGGQAVQVVWRVAETRLPRTLWPTAANLITLERVTAIDCGMINDGAAVRASWPVSIFATGARVHVKDLEVRTRLPVFDGGTAGPSRSHGVLVNTWGEEGRRTPELVIDGLSGLVVQSDRPEIRATAAGDVVLRRNSLREEGGDGVCTLAFVEDCASLLVEESSAPVRILFAKADKPWTTVREVMVSPGARFTWTRPPLEPAAEAR